MITHDLDSLFRTCSRVGVIVDHRMITDTLDGLLRNPHPWIQEYFHGARGRAAEASRPMDWTPTTWLSVRFVLLVIAMAVSFVFWYTDQQDKRSYQRYEIYFQGTVSGLTPGSPCAISESTSARSCGFCSIPSSASACR